MKTQIIYRAGFALTLCLLLCNCSRHKEAQSDTSAVNPNEPAIELKPKWTLNQPRLHHVEISAGAANSNQNVTQSTVFSFDYSITAQKARQKGGYELELAIVSTKLEFKTGDRVYKSFDSTHDTNNVPTDDRRDPMTPAFRKLVGAKLHFVTDPHGKLEQMNGYDDLMVRIARGSTGTEMLKAMFDESLFRTLCDSAHPLPDHPVRRGETWKDKTEVSFYGGAALLEGKYNFDSWEEHAGHHCVRLDYNGAITGKGTSGLRFAIDKGRVHGSSWFDPESGIIVGGDSDNNITITAKQRGKNFSQAVTETVSMRILE